MARPVKLPDPLAVARAEAAALKANPAAMFDQQLARIVDDTPYIDRESLLEGLADFHKERMAKVPSPAKYPESVPWVDQILTIDRELQRLTGFTDAQMAQYRSLGDFLTFRGYSAAKPVMVEKCRVAYLPDSEVGQIHVKNVDDPATYWKTLQPAPKAMPLSENLVQDGTGSGLHIDDEPEDIFPLNPRGMLSHYADDVPGGVQFFRRYSGFWGGANLVLRDKQKRSVAIEKCSRNFMEVFEPGPDGRSHCSGMVCRDPNSPQGKYQRAKRSEYLKRYGQDEQSCGDQNFWDRCDVAEKKLAAAIKSWPAKVSLSEVLSIFATPWPGGLSKEGGKHHPKQAVEEYTLITHASLLDRKEYIRYQRDPVTLKMPKEPERFKF